MHGRSLLALLITVVVLAGACSTAPDAVAESGAVDEQGSNDTDPASADDPSGNGTETDDAASGDADAGGQDPEPTGVEVAGTVVSTEDGRPLSAARVSAGDETVVTDTDGEFTLADVAPGTSVTVERPVHHPVTIDGWESGPEPMVVELEPVVVRGLRVSRYTAADAEEFAALLDLADETSVNALVFDTKDEADTVLYATEVAFAAEIDAVDPVYEPAELIAAAKERGLYTVTRIVTFEDTTWVNAKPEAKLAGHWVDAADRDNWAYPLDLAIEACRLGFDEIQFDYVRFPAGRTAEVARPRIPPTSDERAATIATFLAEAKAMLHAEGCGVSAAVFGIVMSSLTDEGIGQTPEATSASVDALSPMLYPSHYGPGWLGFPDPNDHPGPVIAHALDVGGPKVEAGTLMRPWIQGFFYNASQVRAQIDEAEARGAGWIIWNASGMYRRDWLPSS